MYQALRNIKPRPTLARVAEWQSHARGKLSDASDWHPAASFAVIFAQRLVDSAWERRLEVERTEVEPAPVHEKWPGWDGGPLCAWMRRQLGLRESGQVRPETGAAGQAEVSPPAEPSPSAAPTAPARLRIDSVAITDAVHSLELIRAGAVTAALPEELIPPVRLILAVSGGRPGQQVQAAVWFRRHAQPGWSPHEPVTLSPSGQAEFDLTSVPAGEHKVRLLAWATDAGSTLAAVTLPNLTVHQRTGQGQNPAVLSGHVTGQ